LATLGKRRALPEKDRYVVKIFKYFTAMPIPEKYIADFEEEGIYHIYNRTNNKEPLFLNDENRFFFLRKYKELLSPFADTFCWCLLTNHFHLLIKMKSYKSIVAFLTTKPPTELTITEKRFIENKITFSELAEQTFKRFFQSYALAFNKMHNRQGNLFYKPFKRISIDKNAQFTMAIIYIHANAMKHGLVKNFTEYLWSSWHTIISSKPTALLRKEVIEWFGSLEECIKAHNEQSAYHYDCDVAIED
jgi:putative transposase